MFGVKFKPHLVSQTCRLINSFGIIILRNLSKTKSEERQYVRRVSISVPRAWLLTPCAGSLAELDGWCSQPRTHCLHVCVLCGHCGFSSSEMSALAQAGWERRLLMLTLLRVNGVLSCRLDYRMICESNRLTSLMLSAGCISLLLSTQ